MKKAPRCILLIPVLFLFATTSALCNDSGDRITQQKHSPSLMVTAGGSFCGHLALHCPCLDRAQWLVDGGLAIRVLPWLGFEVSYHYGGVLLGGLGYSMRHGINGGAHLRFYNFPRKSLFDEVYSRLGVSVDWITDYRKKPLTGVYCSPGLSLNLGENVSLINELYLSYFWGSSSHLLFGIKNGIQVEFP